MKGALCIIKYNKFGMIPKTGGKIQEEKLRSEYDKLTEK